MRVGHVHVAICIERQPVEAGVLARNGHEHRGSARLRIDGEDLRVLVIDYEQLARVRLETQVKQPRTGALRVDGPQELAVRVEHKETSWARVRLIRSYGDYVDIALGVRIDPLRVCLTRRQRREALNLAAVKGIHSYIAPRTFFWLQGG
jgi:hypothetical protein